MIVNVDARALEWATYLYLCQDPTGIAEWTSVIENPSIHDIHRNNQEQFKLPSRLIAKVFLFRFIYRGSAYAYSKDPDFVHVSKSQDFWQDVIDKYYSKYKELERTHKQYIKQATQTGIIKSPFGREYAFSAKPNKRGEMVWNESDICNYPNQGCGADVMAVARVACYQRMKRAGLRSKLISTVHDSIVADCPDNEVEDVSVLFDKVFKDLPRLVTQAYGVEFNIPMLGELSCGPNMLDLKTVEF